MPRLSLRLQTLVLTAVSGLGLGLSLPLHGQVRPGIEVLVTDSVHLIRGKRVGLITNHSGRARDGTSSIDLLFKTPGVRLTALFGPEHGLRGAAEAGDPVASAVDSATGVTIYSLYGTGTNVPVDTMLKNVDVVVFDIQDIGARTYTYQWTMALSAAAVKKPFIVTDRPDPIRADVVEGNILDPKYATFVGRFPVALRYGLTPGELLRYLVGEKLITADIKVIPMSGYRRDMWWDATGLKWTNPSPNIRDLDAALLFPGTVFFEGANVSEGRGTDAPFSLIGAKWLRNVRELVTELNGLRMPGVAFEATERVIARGAKLSDSTGRPFPFIKIKVTDRNAIKPVTVGVRMMRAIYARHSDVWEWRVSHIDRLAGTDELRLAVQNGTIDDLLVKWEAEAKKFSDASRKYWLYP
jgi:uncharacterized protein YbbC (DUF1343 family)